MQRRQPSRTFICWTSFRSSSCADSASPWRSYARGRSRRTALPAGSDRRTARRCSRSSARRATAMAAAGGRAAALVDNRRLRAMPEAEIENIIRNGMPERHAAVRLAAGGRPSGGDRLRALAQRIRVRRRACRETWPPARRSSSGKGNASSCHIARGRGAAGGPDLSNVGRQMTLPELTRALDRAQAPRSRQGTRPRACR